MVKKLTFLLLTISLGVGAHAQGVLGKLGKKVKGDSSQVGSIGKLFGKGGGGSLSNEEIIGGLKEALTIGAQKSATELNKADGFFTNAAIKILMPEEAKKAETTLRKFGMGSLVDKAILSMNRAAEDAAGGISTIFINAIKGMSLQDGLSILRGGDFAATDFLKKSTTAQLTEKMRPVIAQSLEKVDASKYWKDVFTAYNRLSKDEVNTDLTAYVTERSLQGIFYSIGQEEQKIRKDPAAQVTDLLRKVFAK